MALANIIKTHPLIFYNSTLSHLLTTQQIQQELLHSQKHPQTLMPLENIVRFYLLIQFKSSRAQANYGKTLSKLPIHVTKNQLIIRDSMHKQTYSQLSMSMMNTVRSHTLNQYNPLRSQANYGKPPSKLLIHVTKHQLIARKPRHTQESFQLLVALRNIVRNRPLNQYIPSQSQANPKAPHSKTLHNMQPCQLSPLTPRNSHPRVSTTSSLILL